MTTLLIRLVFLVALVAAGWAIWQIWKRYKKKQSPEDKLNEIIDEQTEGLHAAAEALRASESYVRQIEREVEARRKDVRLLDARVKKQLGEGNEEGAKATIATLQVKERDLAEKETAHTKAVEEHQKYARVVDEYRQNIKDLKQEASELQIRSKLAKAEQRAQALHADMKTSMDTVGLQAARDELEQQIVVAKSEAEIDRRLASSPEDEFLDHADRGDTSVDDRLAQYKKEVG